MNKRTNKREKKKNAEIRKKDEKRHNYIDDKKIKNLRKDDNWKVKMDE